MRVRVGLHVVYKQVGLSRPRILKGDPRSCLALAEVISFIGSSEDIDRVDFQGESCGDVQLYRTSSIAYFSKGSALLGS